MALPLASGVLTVKCSLAMLLLVLVLVLSASPGCHGAQNITAILAAHPDLGEFSSLLTSTGLADDINQRSNDGPITVLAVNNTGMARASLKTMPREAIRSHLSLHVLLDCYYDDAKLQRLPPGGSALVSTLFHAAGDAPGVYGMVRIVKYSQPSPSGAVAFLPNAGARQGVGKFAFYVKSVTEAPYSVSVLQVSGVMSPITRDAA